MILLLLLLVLLLVLVLVFVFMIVCMLEEEKEEEEDSRKNIKNIFDGSSHITSRNLKPKAKTSVYFSRDLFKPFQTIRINNQLVVLEEGAVVKRKKRPNSILYHE